MAKPQPSTFGFLGWKAIIMLAMPCLMILALNGHLHLPASNFQEQALDHVDALQVDLTPRQWNRTFEAPPRLPISKQQRTVPSYRSHSCYSRPWLEQYAKLHVSIMKGDQSVEDTRYFILRPHERAGLGNRVRAIQGALALAVLTKRALLLDFGPRSNDTEAGLFLPQRFFDWRLPTVWPHNWSPYVDTSSIRDGTISSSSSSSTGSGIGYKHPLRKDGVRVLYHNQKLGDKESSQLWPDVRALVLDGQNHDASSSLFSNHRLDSLMAAASMTAQDVKTWPACALRSLFVPRHDLASAVCRSRSLASAGSPPPLLAIHLRSEGKHETSVANSPLWSDVIDATVACALRTETLLLKALEAFVSSPSNHHHSGTITPSSGLASCEVSKGARCHEAQQWLSSNTPRWAVLADRSDLVEAVKLRAPPGRVIALNDNVRVHSGLLAGGSSERVMGTAFGPLQDLLFASDALALVGSAGSSFSEVLAALLGLDAEYDDKKNNKEKAGSANKILIRTPFIKSSQGPGLKASEAMLKCSSSALVTDAELPLLTAHVERILSEPKFLACEEQRNYF